MPDWFRSGPRRCARQHPCVTAVSHYDLRHALDNGELEVFYQPIVNAHDTTPVGAEALVRWHHPRRGFGEPHRLRGRRRVHWTHRPARRLGPEPGLPPSSRLATSRRSRRRLLHQRQPFRPPTRRTQPRRKRRPSPSRFRASPRRVSPGDHREHPHAELRRRVRPPTGPQSPRTAARPRRLRYRLLVAQPVENAPGRHRQDRQVLHRPAHPEQRRDRSGPKRHRRHPRPRA